MFSVVNLRWPHPWRQRRAIHVAFSHRCSEAPFCRHGSSDFPSGLRSRELGVVVEDDIEIHHEFIPPPRSASSTTIGLSLRLESPSRSGSEPGTVGQQRLLK